MSKIIKVTVVMDDEKLNTESGPQNRRTVIVTHDSSMTIMSTLLKNNLIGGSFCGGRGDCGRCRVQFLEGAVMPAALERSLFEPEELRQGYRLACLAKPKDDCVIKLALADAPKIDILTDMIDVTENNDCVSQPKPCTENHKSYVTKPEGEATVRTIENNSRNVKQGIAVHNSTDSYATAGNNSAAVMDAMIAVDLGTTTIAMQLMTMDTEQVIDTYCALNPQRRYGSDVLSRIKASCEGARESLRQLVVEVLSRGADRFRKHSVHIRCMCIAGNTTMEHLLMGYDVSSLGSSPFTPAELGLQEYKNPAWDFPVWLTPGISAFVGGDIAAGLYALDMLHPLVAAERREDGTAGHAAARMPEGIVAGHSADQSTRVTFLIDLGTNGELAITDGRRMIVTATAAGPAFEGGAGAEIVGSDMIACAAELLRKGILDETGLLAEPYFTEGVTVGEPAVRLRNQDIRDLQMAKAAVRAGIELLWRQMGEPELERVYLAGGFGYYLDVEAAFEIGLLPERMRGRVQSAGNMSLAGAYRIGRDLWRHKTDRHMLAARLSSIESINLAAQEDFEGLYIRYMNFRKE